MSFQIFSKDWALAWQQQLNENQAYRKAAAKWEWPLVLILDDPQAPQQIYLDLWQGHCREARPAIAADIETVPYVISAPTEKWQQILSGEIDPMIALMRGHMKLDKGKMFALARYGSAAKQLVLSAAKVPGYFPGTADRQDTQNGAAQPQIRNEDRHQLPGQQPRPVFKTTSSEGLRRDILPMRLFEKAKTYGIWNPSQIDLSKDKRDWQQLDDLEREVLLQLTALFQAGEESVTIDILPLISVIAREGRLEEEMFLTTFLWEEAKHVDFFRRFLDEVIETREDLTRFHTPSYCKIFYEELPTAMNRLYSDSSPAAQLEASLTYNMIVEGTLAETGYYSYYEMLERNDLLPGLRQGIQYLKRDESRHIAYGIYLLSRLLAENPELWPLLEKRMGILIELALNSIVEFFSIYPKLPFGLEQDQFIVYATGQFNKRMDRLERARKQSLEEILQTDLPE